MKKKPKTSSIVIATLCLVLSAAYIAACIIMRKFDSIGGNVTLASYVLTFAVFILAFFLVTRRDKEPVESDERTRRLTDRAYAYSWLLTYFALLFIYAVDFLFPLNLSMRSFGIIVILFMALSAIIMKAVMMRKGNAE